ncbi:MAG: AMP-binding protein [Chitinophagaceae bacterium]
MTDVIKFIKENASRFPNRIAIIDGERKISYADFINLVDSISHQLIINSVKPRVAFDLRQGAEAYALIVAILNVGGTYCPLHPDAPIERKIQIITQFKPDLIIVENEISSEDFEGTKVVSIHNLLRESNFREIETNYDGEDIIYVIYTSGTTGTSKGVMICRKALNKFLEWAIPTYGAGAEDIWGQFSFLSFDLSIVDIFTCLCSGATLFAMNDIPAKKNRPAGIIERDRITIWHSIPSAVEFMMANERTKVYDFSSLRLMSFCGEALKKSQVEFLFEKKNDLIIFNTYGPTEGTLFCTWQELTKNTYVNFCNFNMSIGKAIPGWSLELNPADGFEEKEIIIYGDYIGAGYLVNPIDSKFRKIEIGNNTVNAFETGDLVNEKNGNLYFSCRKDRQVKIKGFRVELDEIDLRINEYLNKPSVTVVRKDSLYSFIESEEKINDLELRQHLKKKLELNKIPNTFYAIKEIPRTQNQKVDNNALIQLIP